MKTFGNLKRASAVLSIGLSFFAIPVFAQGDYGLGEAAGEAQLSRAGAPENIAGLLVGTLLSLMGILFFLLMLYGGFLWMTARGNEEQTKKATQVIYAAVIGIIIVLGSYALTQFVLGSVRRTAPSSGDGTSGLVCCVYRDVAGSRDVAAVTSDNDTCNSLCTNNPSLYSGCTPTSVQTEDQCF